MDRADVFFARSRSLGEAKAFNSALFCFWSLMNFETSSSSLVFARPYANSLVRLPLFLNGLLRLAQHPLLSISSLLLINSNASIR